MVRVRDELIPTRQSLLDRLQDWTDQEGWREFFDTYWKLIYRTARRAGLTDAEAQDVVQETVLSVCKSMRRSDYRPGKGPFKSWLLRLTAWRITDQIRRRLPPSKALRGPSGDSRRTPTAERVPAPGCGGLEEVWMAEWEGNLVSAAVERVKRKVDPSQYQLFDLYVLRKWPVRKIRELVEVSAGRVYLAKHRISRLIRKEISYLETKWK